MADQPRIRPIEDLLSELRAKPSVLEPFADDIMRAVAAGASYPQITKWLSDNNVKISRQNLHQWVLRRQKRLVKRAELVSGVLPVSTQMAALTTRSSGTRTPKPNLEHLNSQGYQSGSELKAATASLDEKPTGRATGLKASARRKG